MRHWYVPGTKLDPTTRSNDASNTEKINIDAYKKEHVSHSLEIEKGNETEKTIYF